jgi:hypothetical protein
MFREFLAKADRRIRATKTHIHNQERLIERLADEGRNTDEAFALLNILAESLRQFERYRMILDRLGF